MKDYNVGIIGASGYGGNELVRLLVHHPQFALTHVAGETSAGSKLSQLLPWVTPKDDLVLKKCDDALPDLDLVFISLPTGMSKAVAAGIGDGVKIVDLGEDHRFVEGWQYGLADIWPDKISHHPKVSNPGCYPSAVLATLAPIISTTRCSPASIKIAAMSGVSGAGRGGGKTMGFADVNEDASVYKLGGHSHTKEMGKAIALLSGNLVDMPPVFVPHLIPMTRGILATCFVTGDLSADECMQLAREYYKRSYFVRVWNDQVKSKWATGTNLVFITYAKQGPDTIIAVAAIDNLGKGAAGQAVQNANLMLGINPTVGLENTPLIP